MPGNGYIERAKRLEEGQQSRWFMLLSGLNADHLLDDEAVAVAALVVARVELILTGHTKAEPLSGPLLLPLLDSVHNEFVPKLRRCQLLMPMGRHLRSSQVIANIAREVWP